MARYYRRRRHYRRGRHWSSRLNSFSGEQSSIGDYTIYHNLCQNPNQQNTTVSNLYTVKNIDCQFELTTTDSGLSQPTIENLQFYIIYVPQGVIPTGVPSSYQYLPYDHPEWIMAHRYVGSPTNDANQTQKTYKIKTRLSRKLDTGDRIILLILGTNTSSSTSYTLGYQGLVKYVTKSN